MRTKTWIVLLLGLLALTAKAAVVPIKFSEFPNTNTVQASDLFLVAVTNQVPVTNKNIKYIDLLLQISNAIPVTITNSYTTNTIINTNIAGGGESIWTNRNGIVSLILGDTNSLKVMTNGLHGIFLGDTNAAASYFGWPANGLTYLSVLPGTNRWVHGTLNLSNTNGSYMSIQSQAGVNPILSEAFVNLTNGVISSELDLVLQRTGGYLLLGGNVNDGFVGIQSGGQLSVPIGPNLMRAKWGGTDRFSLSTNGDVSFFGSHTNNGVLYAKSNFIVSGITLINGTFAAGSSALFLKGLSSLGITNTIGFETLGRINLGDDPADLTTSSNLFRQYGPMHIHDRLHFQNVGITPGELLYVASGDRSAATVPGVNSTTAGYLAGVTSLIQPQLNSKQVGSAALTNLASNPNVVTNIVGVGINVNSNGGTWTLTSTGGVAGASGASLWTNIADHSVLRTIAGSTNFIGGGSLNVIATNNTFATVSGGTSNIVSAVSSFSAIGGGVKNLVGTNAPQATIAGGATNSVTSSAYGGTVGGGTLNTVEGPGSTVAGGYGNTASGTNSTIGGGSGNRALASGSASGGSVISGGADNLTADKYVTISGGKDNASYSPYSFIGGGGTNIIYGASEEGGETIAGGAGNNIWGARGTTIGGGEGNVIDAAAILSTIAGGRSNYVRSGVGSDLSAYNFIGGGYSNVVVYPSSFSVMGGGEQNTTRSWHGVIGGGYLNTIYTNALHSVIAGGVRNSISTNAGGSVMAGGSNNVVSIGSPFAVVSGGRGNTVRSHHAVIGGGGVNTIATNSNYSVIAGGFDNEIDDRAFGAVVSGGSFNTIQAGSTNSTIMGGSDNLIRSNSIYSAILGGQNNQLGNLQGSQTEGSFIIGHNIDNTNSLSVEIGWTADRVRINQTNLALIGRMNFKVEGGSVAVGPTPALVTNILAGSALLTWPLTAAQGQADRPITVTGCTSNTPVFISVPWQSASVGGVFTHYCSNDTVYVRYANHSAVGLTPPPGTFTAIAMKVQ